MKEKKTPLYIAAQIIRIISVPPIMVLTLLLLVYHNNDSVFRNLPDLLLSVAFLVAVPILAYPISFAVPRLRAKGRDGQRNLAFVMSICGYTAGLIYGIASKAKDGLVLIFLTYFVSVLLLTFFNKVLKLRASGHACSITGPLVFCVYFIGWKTLLPCVAIFALIVWSSLLMKRHTARELIFGSLSAVIAFFVSLGMMFGVNGRIGRKLALFVLRIAG